jgi:hypothetical protein
MIVAMPVMPMRVSVTVRVTLAVVVVMTVMVMIMGMCVGGMIAHARLVAGWAPIAKRYCCNDITVHSGLAAQRLTDRLPA